MCGGGLDIEAEWHVMVACREREREREEREIFWGKLA